MKNDLLKTLAMKAKNRMINKNLRDTYANTNVKIIDKYDKAFYEKVKEIITDNEDIFNPLKRLMDENKLMNLDPHGRERYLLETIEKYQQARRMIQSERNIIC